MESHHGEATLRPLPDLSAQPVYEHLVGQDREERMQTPVFLE